jgi:FtsH-binding integral membrane protein
VTVLAEVFYLFTRHSKFSQEYVSPINFYATTAATGAALGLIFTMKMSTSDLLELKSIFLSSFIFTFSIFLTMTIFAILTVRRVQIFFGCIIGSLVLSIIGIFVVNTTFSAIIGLIIGVLYVVVDTQLMINKAEQGMIEPFEDARHLYYNLLRIFLEIIILLSKNKKKKDN